VPYSKTSLQAPEQLEEPKRHPPGFRVADLLKPLRGGGATKEAFPLQTPFSHGLFLERIKNNPTPSCLFIVANPT
jgi:hypothetical protein